LDTGEGSVITKAGMPEAAPASRGVWEGLGISGEAYAPLRLVLSHELVGKTIRPDAIGRIGN
jgi:hypothetical protein